MLGRRSAIRGRRRRVQIGLKESSRARGVGENHRIDVFWKGNWIQRERLTALTDDLLPFVDFDGADLLSRLAVAAFVEFVLRMRMAGFEKGSKNRLISFLDQDRRAHCRGRANSTDVIIVMVGNGDILYGFCW